MSPSVRIALCLLGGCGVVAIGLVVWRSVLLIRRGLRPVQVFLYAINYMLTRHQWRAKIRGELTIPLGEGGIIIANHRSSIDPFFTVLAMRRVIHWMVAREYCEHWAFRWFLRNCEVIPVGRSGVDTAATKMAIRLAAEGELVGIFPEGRINTTDEILLPGRPGAVLIALKARVPIVPCYIEGSPYKGTAASPLLMRAHAVLTIGEPIDLSPYYGQEDDRAVLETLTKRVLAAIAELAGQSDFQPQLAGRFYKPQPDEADSR